MIQSLCNGNKPFTYFRQEHLVRFDCIPGEVLATSPALDTHETPQKVNICSLAETSKLLLSFGRQAINVLFISSREGSQRMSAWKGWSV